jgi:hypothetical protein
MIAADLVADATDSADQGAIGAGVYFAAEVIDIDVDDIGDGIPVDAPDLFN